MFKNSIYKKIEEDFSFIKDYGFEHFRNIKTQFDSVVLFKSSRYFLEIGYYDKRISAVLYDTAKKRHKATDKGWEWIEKVNVQENYRVCEYMDLLERIALVGKSYKEQVSQVKNIVLEYIQKL